MEPRLTAPPRESAARDQVLAILDGKRAEYLAALRLAMRQLYRERAEAVARTGAWHRVAEAGAVTQERTAFVTADDARALFESWRPPAPTVLDRNFLGAVWREQGWRPLSQRVASVTPGSHANELRCWIWAPA